MPQRNSPTRRRLTRGALLVTAATGASLLAVAPAGAATSAGAVGSSTSAASSTASSTTGTAVSWKRVYRHDLADLTDIGRMQSTPQTNDTLRPNDTSNVKLQKPVLASNVFVTGDTAASDGRALEVLTRKAAYQTSSGLKIDWANGRMSLNNHAQVPPVRIVARLRMTPSAGVKTSVMWWPSQGWPWEVDFAENFAGLTTTDEWGSRQKVSERWHADLDHDGQATEQLIHDVPLNATQYHVFDLQITPSLMSIRIDGRLQFSTSDRRWIPTGSGFFAIGKALGGGSRTFAGRTNDAVFLDWLELYKPV